LPRAVTEALNGKYPQATLKKIEWVIKVKDGQQKLASYEILLVMAETKTLEVGVAPSGKITKVEDKAKKKN
jgi:hypothetical protein